MMDFGLCQRANVKLIFNEIYVIKVKAHANSINTRDYLVKGCLLPR